MKRTIIIALSVVALVFGVISYASAIGDDTTVKANVKTMLELTAPDTVVLNDGDEFEPDDSVTAPVTLAARSNKPATLTASPAPNTNATLASSVPTPGVANLRGGNIEYIDTLTASVNWDFDPGTGVEIGKVTYSLVQ